MYSRTIFVACSLLIAIGAASSVAVARAQSTPVAGCPQATPTAPTIAPGTPAAGAGGHVPLAHGEALLWGAGEHGVVLVHGAVYDAASWTSQAEAMAARGMIVLAVEELSAEAVLDGVDLLRGPCGVRSIALIGASAGTGPVLQAAAREPEAVDQIIVLSGSGDVSQLDDDPKLFVASEGEGIADTTRQMADEAPGDDNEALIVPGDAHAQAIFRTEEGDALLTAIIAWLEETRSTD
ncbi:MAG: alpha/beta hydrolase [Thermomicrobiales bacterium]